MLLLDYLQNDQNLINTFPSFFYCVIIFCASCNGFSLSGALMHIVQFTNLSQKKKNALYTYMIKYWAVHF